jgi:hypothetical protein
MKTYARRFVAVAGLALLGSAALVQAQSNDTITEVPFAFTVGTTAMARDTYRISRLTGPGDAFLIKGDRSAAIVTSQPSGASDSDNTPRLVFHRYGSQYFLHEVRLPDNRGFVLPQARTEREAASKLANGTRPDVVILRGDSE